MAETFSAYPLYSVAFLQNVHVPNKRTSGDIQPLRQLVYGYRWLFFKDTDNP